MRYTNTIAHGKVMGKVAALAAIPMVLAYASCCRDHLYYETSLQPNVQLNIDWSRTAFSPSHPSYDPDNPLNGVTIFAYDAATQRLVAEFPPDADWSTPQLRLAPGTYDLVIINDSRYELPTINFSTELPFEDFVASITPDSPGLVSSSYPEHLTSAASTPAVGTAVDVTNLNMFTVANVFYGNYENTGTLGLENDYRPFYVKAKVNEVAYYVGLVKLNEGKYELWGEDEVGKLNDKGLEIDTNGVDITTSTKQIEGVLVADTEANGGVKLVALSANDTVTGVETPEADGKAVIYGTKGAVVVAGADGKVTIFDAMGRKVKTVDAKGVTTIQMPAGYYIVHTAETAKSVIVM